MSRLRSSDLSLQYDDVPVIEGVDLEVPDGSLTAIIGPNACGKSTLLKGLARIMATSAGEVLLDGKALARLPTKAVARELAMLPQSALAPDATTVTDLVGRGRYPYLGLLRQWSPEDQRAVDVAMAATGVTDLADRPVNELSGGQRQRVWLAMVLAQDTLLLLLDEPTTFLDITHQIEILDLCSDLVNRGYTVVAVLHDLNQAFRYATHLICMVDGRVVATGSPSEIVDADLVRTVYGLDCVVIDDPLTGSPLVIPAAPPRPTPGEGDS